MLNKTALKTTLAAAGIAAAFAGTAQAAEPTVIDLTQTACQFVEAEGMDHGFTSARKADCEAINKSSGD